MQLNSNKTVPMVDHQRLGQVIKHSCERGVPMFVWGTFGIGKSYTFEAVGEEIAKSKGLKFSVDYKDINNEECYCVITLPLHQYDLAEIKGLPYPSEDKTKTVFLPTDLLPVKGQGIILLDELPCALPIIQSNAYQLILNRKLGSYVVPEGYSIFAAGNRLEDRAHTFEMAYPLKNRMSHVELGVPTSQQWADNFAYAHGIDIRIINFLLAYDSYLFKFDPDTSEEHIAIPTPRTWEMVSKHITGLDKTEDLPLIKLLAESTVGVAAGMDFGNFTELSLSFNVAEMFDTGTVTIPKEVSQVYALMSSITSYYKKKKEQVKGPNAQNELDFQMLNMTLKFSREHTTVLLHQVVNYIDKEYLIRMYKLHPAKMEPILKDINRYLVNE